MENTNSIYPDTSKRDTEIANAAESHNKTYSGYKVGFKEGAHWADRNACDDTYDGYHTIGELYDFRREYNAALVNTGVWKAHKSHRHHTGELCFGGGWFVVMIDTPFGQISNHYEDKYWDEFHCEEKEFADEWDGHTEKDVLERLHKSNLMEKCQ